MTKFHRFGPRSRLYAAWAAAVVALAGFGALGSHELSVASAQAQTLIAQGRSELRQGSRAQAVLSFERAQLLAPRAEPVRSALRDAKVQDVAAGPTEAPHWVAPREWSFLLVMFGWLAGLSLAVAIARQEDRRSALRVAFAAGSLFLLSAVGVVQSTISAHALRVVSSATGVLVAPYPGAGATADLAPGVVVATGSRYGQFIQVCGPNGTRGWVTGNVLEPVTGT
jgi:hypothetical protein